MRPQHTGWGHANENGRARVRQGQATPKRIEGNQTEGNGSPAPAPVRRARTTTSGLGEGAFECKRTSVSLPSGFLYLSLKVPVTVYSSGRSGTCSVSSSGGVSLSHCFFMFGQ